jgi:hypothetical protein
MEPPICSSSSTCIAPCGRSRLPTLGLPPTSPFAGAEPTEGDLPDAEHAFARRVLPGILTCESPTDPASIGVRLRARVRQLGERARDRNWRVARPMPRSAFGTLKTEIAAWERQHGASETRITWMFTTEMGRRVMSAVQRYLVPFCSWRGSGLACRNAGDTVVEGAQPTSFGAVSRAVARRNICRGRPVNAVTYPLVSWQW